MQLRAGFTSQNWIRQSGRPPIVPSSIALAAASYPTKEPSTSASASHFHLVEDLGLEEEQATWFARHRPELLHAPLDDGPSTSTNKATGRLTTRISGLADLLGCTTSQAAAMLQKQPALIDVDSGAIRRRLDGLVRAFGGIDSTAHEGTIREASEDAAGISQQQLQLQAARQLAARAARRVPVLLASDDHTSVGVPEHRLTMLRELLACEDAAEATRIAGQEPLLLVLEPSVVRARVEALQELLDLAGGAQQATQLSRKHPWMMTVSSKSLELKISAMSVSLGLPRKATLGILVSYPPLLSLSERSVSTKVAMLSDHIPLDKLQAMVCMEPSLLARSTDKVLGSLKALREAIGKSTQNAIDLAERRPSILTRSSSAPDKCYRALSVWKLSASEKEEILQKHPLLLTLSPSEVHHRCRWLRALVSSNGYYHSGVRRIPPSLLGVIIMHLPQAWSRLQYLADCNQESRIGLMDTVHMSDERFGERFPQYKRWLQFRTSEMGCKLPWRQSRKRKDNWQPNSSSHGTESSGKSGDDKSESFNWHAARGTSGPRPNRQSVLSEAGVVYYGMNRVYKPQRLVWSSAAACEVCEVEENEEMAHGTG